MLRFEKHIKIVHAVFCALNLGCIFFALMVLSGGGNTAYSVFRALSMFFAIPMLFLRMVYLQYIAFGILLVLDIVIYIRRICAKQTDKKYLVFDLVLWLFTVAELLFLERYYLNILWF